MGVEAEQLHVAEVVAPLSVVTVKVPFEQSLAGTMIVIGVCWPGVKVPLAGLKLIPARSGLLADQFTLLCAFASNERVAEQVQLPSVFWVQLDESKLLGDSCGVG